MSIRIISICRPNCMRTTIHGWIKSWETKQRSDEERIVMSLQWHLKWSQHDFPSPSGIVVGHISLFVIIYESQIHVMCISITQRDTEKQKQKEKKMSFDCLWNVPIGVLGRSQHMSHAMHIDCREENHIKLSYFSPNLTIPSSLCLAVLHRIKMISHIYECVPTLSTVGNFNESDDHIWTFLLSGSWFVGCTTQIWDVGADERCCDIGQSKERDREHRDQFQMYLFRIVLWRKKTCFQCATEGNIEWHKKNIERQVRKREPQRQCVIYLVRCRRSFRSTLSFNNFSLFVAARRDTKMGNERCAAHDLVYRMRCVCWLLSHVKRAAATQCVHA